MVDVDSVLDDPGLNNGPAAEFVRCWADVTGAVLADGRALPGLCP